MNFWKDFNTYVGVQGILALMVTAAMLVMIFLVLIIPDQLWTLLGLSWGFYFAKNGHNVVNRVTGNV